MSLETLEGLPEEVASLYKKGEDGKFHLEGSDGLKSALQKERERANAAEKALKGREAEEAKMKADAEKARLEAAGEWEKLKASVEAEKAALAKKLQETEAAHELHLKESKALALFAPDAATPKTLESLKREFMDRLEIVQGKLLVKGDASKTPEQLAAEIKADPEFAPFMKPSGANGGGASNHQGGGGNAHAQFFDPKSPNYSYTKQLELAKADPKAFEALRGQFPDTKQE